MRNPFDELPRGLAERRAIMDSVLSHEGGLKQDDYDEIDHALAYSYLPNIDRILKKYGLRYGKDDKVDEFIEGVFSLNIDINAYTGEDSGDQPFYERMEDGYVCVNVGTEDFRRKDERYGLPICLVKDLRDACFSLRMTLKNLPALKREMSLHDISKKIIEGYAEGLANSKVYEDVGITAERLKEVMRDIAQRVIERNESFPSFQKTFILDKT